VDALKKELDTAQYHLYAGTSYRHCLIWNQGKVIELAQPHDHLGKVIGPFLPEDEMLLSMMKRSFDILKDHPINIERKKQGLNPANCCWFWGAGTKPLLTSFEEKTGKKGVMISAVDLLKGIAVGANMKVVEVPGANGGLHTNYEGKAQAAINALLKEDFDFAYVHVEAPDEMGHQGNVERKIQAIENLDQRVIRLIKEQLEKSGEEYRIVILPDHPTPIRIRTHSSDPVPYLFYDSTLNIHNEWKYNEKEAKDSLNYISKGPMMIDKLFK
jgi:2,3-bisphosphoglycerate-independent phosphoglycerate mutase